MMQRNLLVMAITVLGCLTAGAQGLTNFTDLYIQSGSTLYVETALKNNAGNEIHNDGVLMLAGDVDNSGA